MARGPMTSSTGARANKGWSHHQAGKGQRGGMRQYSGAAVYHGSWDYAPAGYGAGYHHQHMPYSEAVSPDLAWGEAASWWAASAPEKGFEVSAASYPSHLATNSTALLSTDAGSRQPPSVYLAEMGQEWMDFAHLYDSKLHAAGSDPESEDGWMEPPGLSSTHVKDSEKPLQDSLPLELSCSASTLSDPESEIMSVRGGPWLSEFEDDESSSADAWEPRLVRDAYCGHSEPKRRLPKGEPVKKAIPSWGA